MKRHRANQSHRAPKRNLPLEDFLAKYSDDTPITINPRARIPEDHPLWQILTDEQREALAKFMTKRRTT